MCFGLESPFDKSFAGIRSVIIAFHNDDSGTPTPAQYLHGKADLAA
jgi:hypothetical protein